MSNDPVPCVECNCVLIVKDVTDEFSLVCSKLQRCSSFACRAYCASHHPGAGYKVSLKNRNIHLAPDLPSAIFVLCNSGLGGHLKLVQGNSLPP